MPVNANVLEKITEKRGFIDCNQDAVNKCQRCNTAICEGHSRCPLCSRCHSNDIIFRAATSGS